MRSPLAIMDLFLVAASPAPTAPDSWLQARMDRVSEAAGIGRGTMRAVLVDAGAIVLDERGSTFAVPRALLANAPSAQAIDGILAMELSYRQSDGSRRHGASAGEYAALGALVAVTGGVSDGTGTKVIPLDDSQRPMTRSSGGREKALRGLRWTEAAGGCTAALVDYLRALARGPITEGSASPARRLLADMGALASPSTQRCPTGDDQGFAIIQAQLSASAR